VVATISAMRAAARGETEKVGFMHIR